MMEKRRTPYTIVLLLDIHRVGEFLRSGGGNSSSELEPTSTLAEGLQRGYGNSYIRRAACLPGCRRNGTCTKTPASLENEDD